jgi:tRNA A37 threonylcarbamoyladenosine modification protein TsaB
MLRHMKYRLILIMYLLIDLSQKDEIKLSLFDESRLANKVFSGRNRELLFSIDKFLRSHKLKKEDLAGMLVVLGAGGFTSSRLAVTVANTFGYVLQIPVLAIDGDQAKDVKALIPELLKQPKGGYVSATYSGEPNINLSQ